MRVYTTKRTIVDLKHFRYCTKHYTLLLTLQQEVPNLSLEIDGPKGESRIPIHKLNLENQEQLRNLNPNEM